MLTLFIILPLCGAFIIFLAGKYSKHISYFMGWFIPAILSILSIKLLLAKEVFTYNIGGWAPPLGITLVGDGLSLLFLAVVNVVVLMAAIYSIPYIEKYTSKWIYFALFLVMHASMNAALLTGDIFNLFVWIEIGGIASYILVSYVVEPEQLEASFKYAVLSSVGLLMVLLGIGLLYAYASTLNMADIARVLSAKPNPKLINFIVVLFIVGFGTKAAIVPFHAWLPDAHSSAPSPISALLSGVLIKSLGVYALIRVLFNVIGMNAQLKEVIIVLGCISMVVGVLLAFYQWDFKRLLAYHSISQIGYILLGIGLGTPLGILGGLFHLVNHSVFKSLLFLNAGAVEYSTGTRDLKQLGGLSGKMPITGSTSLIASMSIAGIPPFNGFWSKFIIIFACIQAGKFWLGFIAVVVSLLTLSSFLKVQKYAFFGELKEQWKELKEVPWLMCLSMIILSLMCIGFGLLLVPAIRSFVFDPAVSVLLNGIKI